MPGTVICLQCDISGGSTSGVFFTLSDESAAPTPTEDPPSTVTVTEHRGPHGPLRGSNFPSSLFPTNSQGSATSLTSAASSGKTQRPATSAPPVSSQHPPVISFPGGPIANISITYAASSLDVSSSSLPSTAVSSSTPSKSNLTKTAAIAIGTSVAAIVASILVLLWLVSVRRKHRKRTWFQIEEPETMAQTQVSTQALHEGSSAGTASSRPQSSERLEWSSAISGNSGTSSPSTISEPEDVYIYQRATMLSAIMEETESAITNLSNAGRGPKRVASTSSSNATLQNHCVSTGSVEGLPHRISTAFDDTPEEVSTPARARSPGDASGSISNDAMTERPLASNSSSRSQLSRISRQSHMTTLSSPPPPYSPNS